MPSTSDVIKTLIETHGGNRARIAKKLTEKAGVAISGQRLGQYAAGTRKPKGDFIALWKETFGDDIASLVKQNVSHETKVSSKADELERSYLDHISSLKEENRDLRRILLNLTDKARAPQET